MAQRALAYRDEKFSPYCFQRKLRDSFEVTEEWSLEGTTVREISFHEAQDFILKYEWLGIMGTTRYSFGMFSSQGHLMCVACFGQTAGTKVYAEPFGEEYASEGIVLVRGATAPECPKNASTFFLSRVMPLMREKGFSFVIAYSDPEAGEIGTVYQAANWTLYGITNAITYLVRPDGKRVDPRIVYKYAKKKKTTREYILSEFMNEGYTYEKSSPKLKYLLIIADKRKKKKLLASMRVPSLPYPKRQEDMRLVIAEVKESIKQSPTTR